jgi:uncharacterized membrane protein/mono/diheme cytochrome c family protein
MSAHSSETDTPKSFTTAWIAAIVMFVVFLIGILIFPPLYEDPKVEPSSMVLFTGRFHPILLHLPLGILGLLCLFELICSTKRGEKKFGEASLLMLIVGSAGALMAVFAGIMLSREGSYAGGNFSLHQTMGLIGTAGVLLSLAVRIVAMGRDSTELLNAYRALYFISFGIMGLGAHFGGNLSHGSKFFTQHAPGWFKGPMVGVEKFLLGLVEKPKEEKVEEKTSEPPKVVESPAKGPEVAAKANPAPTPAPTPTPAPPASSDKLVFQHLILPIFESKCNKCHGEEKQKGELCLDTYEFTMKGGEEGGDKNIVPGKPDESVTVQLISSAEDEDGHMPPEGKDQLTKEETALIKWWIQQGASNTQKLDLAALPADLQAAASAIAK